MSENVVYPIVPNGFADHYPYEKWLFHWRYTPFSDIPISVEYWVTWHNWCLRLLLRSKSLRPSRVVNKNCGIPPSGNFIQENLWSTINFLGTLFQFQTSPGILLMLFNSSQGLEVVVVCNFHQRKQAIYQSAGLPTPNRTCAEVILSMKKIHKNWEIHWKYVDFQNVNPGLANVTKLLGCLICGGTM